MKDAQNVHTQDYCLYLCNRAKILKKIDRISDALLDFNCAVSKLSNLKLYNLNYTNALFNVGLIHLNYF